MNAKTRALTLSALLAALTVAALYIASLLPTMQLSIAAFASIFTAAAIIEAGIGAGINVFVVSTALGTLLLPDKSTLMIYLLFFGHYPIIKSIIERLRSAILQWALKILTFNAALAVMWFLFRELIFDLGDSSPRAIFVFLGGSAILAFFDYGFSKLIWLYVNRISKYIKRK